MVVWISGTASWNTVKFPVKSGWSQTVSSYTYDPFPAVFREGTDNSCPGGQYVWWWKMKSRIARNKATMKRESLYREVLYMGIWGFLNNARTSEFCPDGEAVRSRPRSRNGDWITSPTCARLHVNKYIILYIMYNLLLKKSFSKT